MSVCQHLKHPVPPVWDASCETLILGSFPSVKSREVGFFYGHPQNRFWRVLSHVLDCPLPATIPEKREMLLSHHIALWDVIAECDIVGSSDSSIRNARPNDIESLIRGSRISRIFVNGATAEKLYGAYLFPILRLRAVRLPSTSPANAAWNIERLTDAWRVIGGTPQ
ncbi:MAG: DNA-deoxyinosine glycosylase [Clostridia bacterium]|nr:DNA-deoxyinosine glycosylase [Clostridia bacterium]MDY6185024.1 DNA-deoxyinosine glycosylase [Eubacteriales bacterium]